MDIFNILQLICGLALFLFGMNVMGDALKKSAGNRLKAILTKMTSNPLKGLLLGLGVTAIIQSSSATTVMVVGFVNSGIMTLTQSVGVTMGAEIGTAVTAWLTGLSGIGESGEAVVGVVQWLKPSAWMPILALIGIGLQMFSKKTRQQDIGTILLGFAVLMVGMDLMSGAVSGLKESPEFRSVLTMFNNPLFGVLAGLVLTAVVQSSSASVGILQSLSTTGAVTWGMAVPIIMGQNIGTCVTALIASAGANRDGKRAAFIHLFFNIIGTILWLTAFTIVNALVEIPLMSEAIGMFGIATVHTCFKILSVLVLFPLRKQLEKLACLAIRGKDKVIDEEHLLDERLFATPAIAVESAEKVTNRMAEISCGAFHSAMRCLKQYNEKDAELIRKYEHSADVLEDTLGSYLVKLSGQNVSQKDSYEITKLLRLIGDFERISDHAVNILESAEEMRDKKISFSEEAQRELRVLSAAVDEILTLTLHSFLTNDTNEAFLVEPLEQVIDTLREKIKVQHILRLQKNECTIEHGFVLSDILNNLERVSDHCSNIAGCLIEIMENDAMDMHRYLDNVKHNNEMFDQRYKEYKQKYAL